MALLFHSIFWSRITNVSTYPFIVIIDKQLSRLPRGCRIFIMWITYNNTATPLLCTVFRTTLAFTVQSLMTSMHLILMLRGLFGLYFQFDCNLNPLSVFALYNRKRCIGVVLLSLLAGENITQVVSMVYTIPIITYNPTCHIQRIPRFAATHGFV